MAAPRPSKRTGVVIRARNEAYISRDEVVPSLKPDEILVKTVAVSLNPSDWMFVDWASMPGAIVGVDFAGGVEEMGSEVTGWEVGDRVAGFVHEGISTSSPSLASFCEEFKYSICN